MASGLALGAKVPLGAQRGNDAQSGFPVSRLLVETTPKRNHGGCHVHIIGTIYYGMFNIRVMGL